jgi:stalled ribosome rescue protein Dom34
MKQQNKKQNAGVWIDNQKAMIITSDNDGDYTIKEKLKADENFGGGSEHSMNNAKQSGNLKYFKTISNQLLKYDEILIFGPGKSQEQLQNHLEEDAQFNKKKISIDSAEHLTDPQMIAKVRDFFK